MRNALSDFRREAEELGAERTLAVATSAVRDAENGEAFLGEVEWSYGFATRLLTGDEEAAMTLAGVGPLEPGTVVIDVGGGSTELITDAFRTSLDIGCVRLTERHGDDLESMASEVRLALPPLRAERALNVDGTTAELASLAGSSSVTLAAIDEALAWLTASTDEERRAAPRRARPERCAAGRRRGRPRDAPPPRPQRDDGLQPGSAERRCPRRRRAAGARGRRGPARRLHLLLGEKLALAIFRATILASSSF